MDVYSFNSTLNATVPVIRKKRNAMVCEGLSNAGPRFLASILYDQQITQLCRDYIVYSFIPVLLVQYNR